MGSFLMANTFTLDGRWPFQFILIQSVYSNHNINMFILMALLRPKHKHVYVLLMFFSVLYLCSAYYIYCFCALPDLSQRQKHTKQYTKFINEQQRCASMRINNSKWNKNATTRKGRRKIADRFTETSQREESAQEVTKRNEK